MSIRFSDFGRKLVNDETRRNRRSVDASFKPSDDREFFFNGGLKVGSVVESESQIQEVLDVRSNYVVLINESGQTKKKFARDIRLTQESEVEYPEGTFKGVQIVGPIVERLVEDYNSGEFNDAYAVVKCAKLMLSEQTEDLLFSTLKNIGYSFLVESAEQLAILKIIGTVLGIKGTSDVATMTKQITDAYKKTKLSPEQKAIFDDMIALAKKQGVKISIKESGDATSYDDEKEILGFDSLRRKIKKHTDLAPEVDDKTLEIHTLPGHSLNSSSTGHRHMMVRRMKGID